MRTSIFYRADGIFAQFMNCQANLELEIGTPGTLLRPTPRL